MLFTARAGGKFQPKAKPRGPRLMKKDSIAPTLTSSEPVQTIDVSVSELNKYCEAQMPASGEISFPRSLFMSFCSDDLKF